MKTRRKKLALLSFREDRYDKEHLLIEALRFKRPELVLPRKNSFHGFHIFESPKYIRRIVFKKLNIKKRSLKCQFLARLQLHHMGAYSSTKKLLDTIGYPRKNFMSMRMIMNGHIGLQEMVVK